VGALAPARNDRGGEGRKRGVQVGLTWALAGTLPIAAVAHLWSAYYYLFALCGAALAIGAWLAPRPRIWSLVAVALVALGSAHARSIDAFALARGAWTATSHVNRFYIERATGVADRYLAQLRAARPTLPPRSTLFFAGISGNVGFQTADGPLVRWAYRDSSLRSYYLLAFDHEKARRGPVFFFEIVDDSLREMAPGPDLLYRVALGMLLGERPDAARGALLLQREREPSPRTASYWLAWTELALGERDSAAASLSRAGFTPDAGSGPEVRAALAALRAHDTPRATAIIQDGVMKHAFDAGAHALLADLALVESSGSPRAVLEAFAARALAPGWPAAWRRWAMIQVRHQRYLEGARSLRQYFALAGEEGRGDAEALALAETLRRKFPAVAEALDAPERGGGSR
jgi:hypothetical protein